MATILENFEGPAVITRSTYSGNGWVQSTDSPYSGTYCLSSNNVGLHNTTSATQFTINVPSSSRPPTISFWYKVSSESNYDWLTITLNGVQIVRVSGSSIWQQYTGTVNVGTNTLIVSYSKDGSANAGTDKGYIDDIQITYTETITYKTSSDTLSSVVKEVPFVDDGAYIFSNDVAEFANLWQLDDGIYTGKKLFTMSDNVLNGTYYPIDENVQAGWWGGTLSDINGYFNGDGDVPYLTFSGKDDTTMSVSGIRLVGSIATNDYPVDFRVRVHDGSWILHEQEIVGNTSADFSVKFPGMFQCSAITINVSRVSRGNQPVKLMEVKPLGALSSVDNVLVKVTEAKSISVSDTSSDTVKVKTTETNTITVKDYSSDSALVKVTDTRLYTTVTDTSSDALKVKVSEVKSHTVTVKSTDTLKPKTTETKACTVIDTSSDTVKVKTSESDFVTVKATSVDTILVSVLESKSASMLSTTGDTVKPKTTESSTVNVSDTSLDSLLVKVSETGAIVGKTLVTSDTVKIKTTESAQITSVTFSRSDVNKIKLTEANNGIKVNAGSVDATRIKTTESTAIRVNDNSSDSALVRVTDTSSIPNKTITSADTLKPKTIESKAINVTDIGSDSILTKVTESSGVVAKDYGSDTLLVKVSELVSVNVTDMSSDTIKVKTVDTSLLVTKNMYGSDTIKPKTTEVKSVAVSLSSSDTLKPKTTETSTESVSDNSSDSVKVKVSETDSITATIKSSDTVKFSASGVVTQEYISANEYNPVANINQLLDGTDSPQYKWFALDGNTLDGSFHPLDGTSQTGWWSAQASDSTGSFVGARPRLVYNRGINAGPIGYLRLVGDLLRNDYPVDFNVILYGADGVLLQTLNIVGNDKALWLYNVANSSIIYRIEIEILKVNKPNTVVRLTEMSPAILLSSVDTLKPKTTESRAVTVNDFSSDTISVKTAESGKANIGGTSVDTLKLKLSESKSVNVSDTSSDSVKVKTTEQATVNSIDVSSDTVVVKTTESSAVTSKGSSSDVVKITVSEQSKIAGITVVSSDTVKTKVTETKSTNVSDSSSDIVSVKVTDSGSVTGKLFSVDTAKLATSETSMVPNISGSSSDTLKPKLSETKSVNVTDYSSDTVKPKLSETRSVTATVMSVGTLLVKTTENKSVTVNDFSGDTTSIKAAESVTVNTSSMRTDSVLVKVTEVSSVPNIIATYTEALKVKTSEAKSINASFTSSDTLKPNVSEAKSVRVSGNSYDTTKVKITETDKVTATVKSSDNLNVTVSGVVAQEYVSANEYGSVANVNQIIDGVNEPSYKWFALDGNVLDGTFHTIDGATQVGWWSAQASDANGAFTGTKPKITYNRGAKADVVAYIRLVGDPLRNEFPVDFNIYLYGPDGVLLQTLNVTGNNQPYWLYNVSFNTIVYRIEVEILKINKPNTAARITELSPLILKTSVDTLRPNTVEGKVVNISDTSSDSVKLRLTETASIQIVNAYSTDPAKIKTTETKTVSVSGTLSDVLLPKVSESKAITVQDTSVDTASVKVTDTSKVTVNDSSADTVKAAFSEKSSITYVTVVSSDTAKVKTTEAKTVAVNDASVDTIKPLVTETKSINVSTVRNDTITITVNETESVTASLSKVDNLKVAVAESSNIVVKVVRSETTKVTISDKSFFTTYAITKSDTVKVKVSDVRVPVSVSFSRTDALKTKSIDSVKAMTNRLSSRDSIKVGPNPEFELLLAMGAVDTLSVRIEEVTKMTNVHTRMDEAVRQIFGKVEITYTDPFMDEDIVVTASGSANGTSPSATADFVDKSAYKWFSLSENKLDGTYHTLPNIGDLENSVGWWSDVASKADGTFAVPPVLTATFDPRAIYDLKVYGDDAGNVYPTRFDINLYDGSNTLVYTEAVTSNTDVFWKKALTPAIGNITKMELVVKAVNKPGLPARVNEFFTAVVQTYTDNEVVSIELIEEQSYETVTLPIGNVSANQLEIRLDNTSRLFDPSNTKSPLYGMMRKNRRIKAWLGVEIIEGDIEWHPVGTFWTVTWDAPTWSTYCDVIARDRLELLRNSDYEYSPVFEDRSIYEIATHILEDAGLKPSQYRIDPALESVNMPYVWFPIMSHRDALSRIASAGLARCYCDRDGLVVVEAYAPQPNSVYSFSNDDSIMDSNHPVAWTQLANDIQVSYTPRYWGDLTEVFTSDDAITFQPNETRSEKFICSDIVSYHTAPVVTADASISVVDYTPTSWGMEVTFKNASNTVATVNHISYSAQPLLESSKKLVGNSDAYSIRQNGRQKFSMDHELVQTQDVASTISTSLLSSYKDPRNDVKLDARGNIALRLGDRVSVPSRDNVLSDYFIIRQRLYWEGYLTATVEAQKL